MKKLLGIIVLALLWCNAGFADFKTYKCVYFSYYFNDEGNLKTILRDKPEDIDYNATIIIDTSSFHDKQGSRFFGKATLIRKNNKSEYFITGREENLYKGYRYYFVTDEDVNMREGGLRDLMKKEKDHLRFIEFFKFEGSTWNEWYELNISGTYELWTINNYYKHMIDLHTTSYRCKE